MGLTDPELSVVLTDNDEIRELNRTWRGYDEPTDVLSFPLHEPFEALDADVIALGDIVISLEYATEIVATAEHSERVAHALGVEPESLRWGIAEEVEFLMIHGLLHLIGYDHAEPDEELEMRERERELWLAGRE